MVGPIPLSKPDIVEEVDGKKDTSNILVPHLTGIEAPAEKPGH